MSKLIDGIWTRKSGYSKEYNAGLVDKEAYNCQLLITRILGLFKGFNYVNLVL